MHIVPKSLLDHSGVWLTHRAETWCRDPFYGWYSAGIIALRTESSCPLSEVASNWWSLWESYTAAGLNTLWPQFSWFPVNRVIVPFGEVTRQAYAIEMHHAEYSLVAQSRLPDATLVLLLYSSVWFSRVAEHVVNFTEKTNQVACHSPTVVQTTDPFVSHFYNRQTDDPVSVNAVDSCACISDKGCHTELNIECWTTKHQNV